MLGLAYHAAWLAWDLSHLGSAASLFFALMMAFAIVRVLVGWRKRRRLTWWR